MKKQIFAMAAAAILAITACEKNDPATNTPPNPPGEQKKLDSAVIDAGNYFAFQYDAAGRIVHTVRQWNSQQPGGSSRIDINYVYNVAGQLDRMTTNGGHVNYFYTGNRLDSLDIYSMQKFVGREYFTINAQNQVTSIKGVFNHKYDDLPEEVIRDYSYDANGNVLEIVSRFRYPGATSYITEERIVYEQYDNGRNPELMETSYPQFVFQKNNPRRRVTYNKDNQVVQIQNNTYQYETGSSWPVQRSTITTTGGISSAAVVTGFRYK